MRTDAYWFYPMQLHRHRQMSILELFKVKKLLRFLKFDSINSMNDAKRLYINELCHTLIMQRYENDKNMKFWEFFESKKCFVFIIFVTAVNLVVLDAFWINSRYFHQVCELFATCFWIEPFFFSKKSTISCNNAKVVKIKY